MNQPNESSTEKTSSQSSFTSLSGQFRDAYSKLIQTSHSACLQRHRQLETSHHQLAKAISEIQNDIKKRYLEADQEYCKTAQELASKQDGAQELQEAYQNFIETVRGLQEDEVRRVNEANTEFSTKLQESALESENQARETYHDYLRSIQQAWAGLDVNSL